MKRKKKKKRPLKTGIFYDLVGAAVSEILVNALDHHRGNRTRTAAWLGIQRTYLLRLIRKHEIQMPSSYNREVSLTTDDL